MSMSPVPVWRRRAPLAGAALLSLLAASAAFAQPTTNPVTTAFPGEYAWTDALAWGTVTTTAAVANDGQDDLAVVHAEIATLAASGGGVLYFPAGDYNFSDHLKLKAGVVIRGATPTVADARDAAYAPPTKFWFPQFVWGGFGADYSDKAVRFNVTKKIEVEDAESASRYGIVNVDVHRALIDFVARFNETGTGTELDPIVRDPYEDFAQYFGTGIKNRLTGGEVVVFGNRVNNATTLDPRVPNLTLSTQGSRPGTPRQNAWQIWFNRGHAKIDVHVTDYVLIANNRINDQQWQAYVNDPGNAGNYIVDDFQLPFQSPSSDPTTAAAQSYLRNNNNNQMPREMTNGANAPEFETFTFSDGYGILANRSGRTGFGRMNTPTNEPSLYRKGITVRQNWVYSTQRVGIQASGDGLEVIDNVKRDRPGKVVWMSASGDAMNSNNSATYENRSLDVTGTNILVQGNDLLTTRHTLRDGPYGSVDGEGILVQDNNAGWIKGWRILDNVSNTYIGIYKIWFVRDMVISGNTITAGTILIDGDSNDDPYPMYDVLVTNNTVSDGITIDSGLLGNNIQALNNNATVRATNFGESLNEAVYTFSGNTGGVTYRDLRLGFPNENIVDLPPSVEILSPTVGQTFTPGAQIEVQVRVTLDPFGATPLKEVRFYDGSGLSRDYKQDFQAWYTGGNAIPESGFLVLTDGNSDGIYTGTWTVPSNIPVAQIFPAVEARLQGVTIKNTKTGSGTTPYADKTFENRTYAFLEVSDEGEVLPPGYTAWADTYVNLPANQRGLLDDPDADGIPNLVEYAFGLDPSAAGRANLPAVGTVNEGGIDYVTYTYTATAADVTVTPQIATALGGTWSAATAGGGILVTTVGNTTTIKIPASQAGAFLRVQVTP